MILYICAFILLQFVALSGMFLTHVLFSLGSITRTLRYDDLSTNMDILRCYKYHVTVSKLSPKNSSIHVAKIAFEIWKKMGEDPRDLYRAAKSIIQLDQEYQLLYKARNSISTMALSKRTQFRQKCEQVFNMRKDLTKQNRAISSNLLESSISDLSSIENVPVRELSQIVGPSSANTAPRPVLQRIELNSGAEGNNVSGSLTLSRNCNPSNVIKINENLTHAIDRAGVSNRNAAMIILSTAECLGLDPKNIVCSNATIWRQRMKHRREKALIIKDTLHLDFPLTLHWDGKLFIANGVRSKIVAVVVSNSREAKLLAAPEVTKANSECYSQSIFSVLQDWGLVNTV